MNVSWQISLEQSISHRTTLTDFADMLIELRREYENSVEFLFNDGLIKILSISSPSEVMTGSYNNFFRMFGRDGQPGVTLEASWEISSSRCPLRPWRVCAGSRRKEDEIGVDCLDFSRKILHTSWHPQDGIIAMATVNNLYIFQEKLN